MSAPSLELVAEFWRMIEECYSKRPTIDVEDMLIELLSAPRGSARVEVFAGENRDDYTNYHMSHCNVKDCEVELDYIGVRENDDYYVGDWEDGDDDYDVWEKGDACDYEWPAESD